MDPFKTFKTTISTPCADNYDMTGCVINRGTFRRYFSDKSADSAAPLPPEIKTPRANKRNIPILKLAATTLIDMEKAEKRNRRLTRKAKKAKVKFATEDSSSTNSAEENQCRPIYNLGTELIANGNLTTQINSIATSIGIVKGNLIVRICGISGGVNTNTRFRVYVNTTLKVQTIRIPQCPGKSLSQYRSDSKRSDSKRCFRCLCTDRRPSSMKRSHKISDTTYTVNQESRPTIAPTQATLVDMPSLAASINIADDQNNNDVEVGMEPTVHSLRRNEAIEAVELMANGNSSSVETPLKSSTGMTSTEPSVAILPTPLREEIGINGARQLALAAIGNTLANEQLNRVQPLAAEPHIENMTPGDEPENITNPLRESVNDGGLSVSNLENSVFEIDTVEIDHDGNNDEEWVDATPSSTSSSDVERHEEIRCQTVNTKASTSTSSMDLSAMFPEEVDRLVDKWSLRQIGRGNTDEEFLNADRNKRIEMMSMGRYESDEDPEELRRHRHPSEEDIEIYIYSSGDENGPWVPMPRAGEASASGALMQPRKTKNSRRSRPRRKTALPPFPPTRAGNPDPSRGALEPIAVHTVSTNAEDRLRLFSSFKENVMDTPRASDNASTQKIVTPYQETVETPPMIYSVVDNGKDFTEILKDMEIKAIKYTKLEAVLAGSSDVSMENRVKTAEENYNGVVKRNDYLENMHHLFLSGIAARDASVTDCTNAKESNVHTPPPPSTGASLAAGNVTFVPPVKSAEDAARAIVDLRKEADRLIIEADRLTEANEAAAETTALLIREAEKIVAAIESKMEEEPLTRISQGL